MNDEREPELHVAKVSAMPIHPNTIRRYEAMRAELEELLTPEALARIDVVETEAIRRFLFGGGGDA